MLDFEQYAKIKNKYCLCYFGHNTEYLVQLKLVRPLIERKFPNLKISLCSRDEHQSLLEKQDFPAREIKVRRSEFAFMREITHDGKHPVEAILEECQIPDWTIHTQRIETGNCAVLGDLGDKLPALARMYELKFGNFNWLAADAVVGKESAEFYQAAAIKPSILVAQNGGTRLYKKLFPNGEIYSR
jgi:hypothetical protein